MGIKAGYSSSSSRWIHSLFIDLNYSDLLKLLALISKVFRLAMI